MRGALILLIVTAASVRSVVPTRPVVPPVPVGRVVRPRNARLIDVAHPIVASGPGQAEHVGVEDGALRRADEDGGAEIVRPRAPYLGVRVAVVARRVDRQDEVGERRRHGQVRRRRRRRVVGGVALVRRRDEHQVVLTRQPHHDLVVEERSVEHAALQKLAVRHRLVEGVARLPLAHAQQVDDRRNTCGCCRTLPQGCPGLRFRAWCPARPTSSRRHAPQLLHGFVTATPRTSDVPSSCTSKSRAL
jgi:hypothetical protein